MILDFKEISIVNRNSKIDELRLYCAILVVFIHASFPGDFGETLTIIARCAVPIFFMITGYFYSETVKRNKELSQLKKIAKYAINFFVVYFLFDCIYYSISGELFDFLREINYKDIIKFILFNKPISGEHLWYLFALTYCLIIYYFIFSKFNCKHKFLSIPFLLIFDLIAGKYSLLIFGKEFPYYLTRNFLFSALPFFLTGEFINQRLTVLKRMNKIIYLIIAVFGLVMSLIEHNILFALHCETMRSQYFGTSIYSVGLFIYAVCAEDSKIGARIARWGRLYSLPLYIVHPMIIKIINLVFDEAENSFIIWLRPISVLALSFALSIFIKYIEKKRN